MYFLNYVDRNAIAQARLNNLEKDLGMSGVEFNTTVSMSVKAKQLNNANTDAVTACSWDMF
jgi:hypothetical protein